MRDWIIKLLFGSEEGWEVVKQSWTHNWRKS